MTGPSDKHRPAIRHATAYLDACKHTRVALRFDDDHELDLPIADFLVWLQREWASSAALDAQPNAATQAKLREESSPDRRASAGPAVAALPSHAVDVDAVIDWIASQTKVQHCTPAWCLTDQQIRELKGKAPYPTLWISTPTRRSLREFVTDLHERGLRFDLNPTLEWRDEESLAHAFLDYIKQMDESLRERAAQALVASPPSATVPTS